MKNKNNLKRSYGINDKEAGQCSAVERQSTTISPQHAKAIISQPSNTMNSDADESNEFFSFPCNPLQLNGQKDRFFLFARILFKYLEHRDPTALEAVRVALRDMAFLGRHTVGGLDAVSHALDMYHRLKEIVSPAHWQSALLYYKMFLAKKGQQRRAEMSMSSRACIIPPDQS